MLISFVFYLFKKKLFAVMKFITPWSKYREKVSILRPLGYGPNALPLRHPDTFCWIRQSKKSNIFNVLCMCCLLFESTV